MRLSSLGSVVIVLLVAAAVAVMVLGNGCSWLGDKVLRRGNVAVAAMRQMPRGATQFSYWSIKQMAGEDTSLFPIYDEFTPTADVTQLQKLGIVRKSILYAAKAIYGADEIVLLGVDYSMSSLEEDMANLGWENAVYEGVGVWTPPQSEPDQRPMALKKGVIMMASGKDLEVSVGLLQKSIDAEKGNGVLDLYEDQALKRVVDNLPAGLITKVSSGGSFPDARANGASYQKGRASTIKVIAICSFEDNPAANSNLAAVAEEWEQAGFSDVKAVRKANLIQATGVISIADFVDDLTW